MEICQKSVPIIPTYMSYVNVAWETMGGPFVHLPASFMSIQKSQLFRQREPKINHMFYIRPLENLIFEDIYFFDGRFLRYFEKKIRFDVNPPVESISMQQN